MQVYENVDGTCWAIHCSAPATHTLTMNILATDNVGGWVQETHYCLKDCLYFAAWLPYCYPDEQELVSITPPASELFSK